MNDGVKSDLRRSVEGAAAMVAGLAAIAYPLALHVGADLRLIGTIVLLLTCSLLLRLALSTLETGYKLLGALLGVTLAIGALLAGPERLLRWQPALLNLTLLCAFAYSLVRGTPMIERIARARYMPVGAHNVSYLRRLTGVWVAFFALSTGLSVLSIGAAHGRWVLWNGRGVYLCIALLIIGERLYRIRYRRRLAREGRLPDEKAMVREAMRAARVSPSRWP